MIARAAAVLAGLFWATGCLSTEGYYRFRDGGEPAGGQNGAAGTTGTAGTAGTAGTTGAAGTTGVAGTTGAGGTGGPIAAGAAGRGGTTGAAGRGGTTGAAGVTGAAGSTPGNVLFMDNFESGNGNMWVRPTLGMSTATVITDGSFVFNLASTNSTAVLYGSGDTAWTNQVAEARIKILTITSGSTSNLAGLCVRATDERHFYYLALRQDGRVAIRKNVDGNTTLGSAVDAGIVPNVWYRIRLSAVGTTLTAYVDDVLKVTVTDSDLPNGGVGLTVANANAVFDDVRVTRP